MTTQFGPENWDKVGSAIDRTLVAIKESVDSIIENEFRQLNTNPGFQQAKASVTAGSSRLFSVGGMPVTAKTAVTMTEHGMQTKKEELLKKRDELLNEVAPPFTNHWQGPMKLQAAGDAWLQADVRGKEVPNGIAQLHGGSWEGPGHERYQDILKVQSGAAKEMAGLVSATGNSMVNAAAGVRGLFNSFLSALTSLDADLRQLPGAKLGERMDAARVRLEGWIGAIRKLSDKDQSWKAAVAQAHQYLRDNATLTTLSSTRWPGSGEDIDLSKVRAADGEQADSVRPMAEVPTGPAAGKAREVDPVTEAPAPRPTEGGLEVNNFGLREAWEWSQKVHAMSDPMQLGPLAESE